MRSFEESVQVLCDSVSAILKMELSCPNAAQQTSSQAAAIISTTVNSQKA